MSEPAEKDEFQYKKIELKDVFEPLSEPIPKWLTAIEYIQECKLRGKEPDGWEWFLSWHSESKTKGAT